ncbi:type II secretion system protein GspL [Rhodoferax aquaticus]|uniref:General secretion pathway protein GspL n=1 Tax=Rhodoferax aquaticus TaxID=2527691 RepID=A0A515ELF7_9BURK|nr:type II secretion system protein GspL [Rhodoferax aquaticus]QDL53486.1 general secretion pathway protein GspL [Rhodoferax aquaticus]
MNTLLITLPLTDDPDPSRLEYVLSDDGRAVEAQGSANLDELQKHSAQAHTVIAIVPGRALSWHQVHMPAGTLSQGMFQGQQVQRQRAVLEGLLEDQLLDEPAQMHFALQPQPRAGQPVWVGVCHRAWLQTSLDALRKAGMSPHRVVPEWSPDLPYAPSPVKRRTVSRLWVRGTRWAETMTSEFASQSALWLLGPQDAPHLVWADAHGVHQLPLPSTSGTGLPEPAASLLPAHLAAHAELIAEPAVARLAQALFGRDAEVQTSAQRRLMARHTEWDLAQMDLARQSPLWSRVRETALQLWSAPHWRPARWAAGALVAAQLVGLNVYAWQAQAQLSTQRAAIRNTLTSTFPQVTVVVDPLLQMQRAVGGLRQASGTASERDLETMLSAWGAAATATGGSGPSALEYLPGELRLSGTGLAPEAQERVAPLLAARSLSLRTDGDLVILSPRP